MRLTSSMMGTGLMMKGVMAKWGLRSSRVTIESLPPPIGIKTREAERSCSRAPLDFARGGMIARDFPGLPAF